MSAAPLRPSPAGDPTARPLTGLVSDLLHETSTLFRKEVELAKVEMEEKAALFLGGLQRTAVGGGLLFAGMLFVLAAAALGLALVMPLWAATLIVGASVALAGWVLIRTGSRELSLDTLQPDRTLRTLAADKAWARSIFSGRHGDDPAAPL
jgi:hypothetical protein